MIALSWIMLILINSTVLLSYSPYLSKFPPLWLLRNPFQLLIPLKKPAIRSLLARGTVGWLRAHCILRHAKRQPEQMKAASDINLNSHFGRYSSWVLWRGLCSFSHTSFALIHLFFFHIYLIFPTSLVAEKSLLAVNTIKEAGIYGYPSGKRCTIGWHLMCILTTHLQNVFCNTFAEYLILYCSQH